MFTRICVAFLVVCAAVAQDSVWVDVEPNTEDPGDPEWQNTDELASELKLANEKALLLYTEYSAKTASSLRHFLEEINGFGNRTLAVLDTGAVDNAPESCRTDLLQSLYVVETNARRAAIFSAENHHKFLLGHMIVFRMHLNKSEDFIKKCDKAVNTCGAACDKIPRVQRWRRYAANELHRFLDDLQHSRRSYMDLLVHSRKKLKHLRKQASREAEKAVGDFKSCLRK
ncbi:uncharacterized protein LOC128672536 [Plodia interpunctella]|uniref:uncharacterized protein LOC128672536 n=1 Tax=Plodia interpunctella TaxID=58824 RepID=UPI00236845B5|nr:uncharacterized protein LOC128672536 [Plodia interpunctella]